MVKPGDIMDKKVGIIIAVIAIVAVAAVAVYFLTNNNEPEPTATILVEDQDGVFFWTEGSGKTIADCLEKTTAGVKVTMTDSSFGKYINAVNGLAGTEDYSGYWSVYLYNNNTWTISELGVSSLETKDNPVVGLFYVVTDPTTWAVVAGGPENVDVPKVSDAKVWDGKTDGTVFAIQSETGLYFYINNATGENMLERFTAATGAYNIPFKSTSRGGISTLFGMGTRVIGQDPTTGYDIYEYWIQYGLEDKEWVWMTTNLKNTDTTYTQMAIFYGAGSMYGGEDPTVPPYKA